MHKIRLRVVIPVIFLFIAAFVMGFVVEDVRASGGSPTKFIQSMRHLPQRLESMVGPGPVEEARSLPLIETYSNVMERLKADYYGKTVDETKLTYDAIRGTLSALDDKFTRFLDPEEYMKMREENEGTFAGIGAQLDTNRKGEVYVKEPLSGTPAERAGVKPNDVILSVNDKSIAGVDIEEVVKKIRGDQGTKVKLSLRRHGVEKPLVKTIVREIIEFQMVKFRMLDKKQGIGYIRLYQFNEKSDVQLDHALGELEKEGLKGLVLDLRHNPGGLLDVAIDIGSRFLDSGPVVVIQNRGGRQQKVEVEQDKHNHKRYPLAVLVDDHSASASEILSGAIKDTHMGTLVGEKTYGKGRVQTIVPLPGGSAAAITTAKYLTPNGTDIHKKGIEPDVKVEQPEIEDLLKSLGKTDVDEVDLTDPKYDVQLTKAIDVVRVKLGLLPPGAIDSPKQAAKTDKP